MSDDMDTKIEWIGRYVDDLKSRVEKLESEVEVLKSSRTYYSLPCPCPSPYPAPCVWHREIRRAER